MTLPKPKNAEEFVAALATMFAAYNQPPAEDDLEALQQEAEAAQAHDVVTVMPEYSEGPRAPWSDLTDVGETNLLYKMPPEIVAKMNWVIDNVPRMNKQRIVRDSVNAELDRLIALYYKRA